MATYSAKFSQDILSAISSHNQNSISTLSGIFNALMNVNNTLTSSHSYSNSWSSSNGSLTQYFNDGSQLKFNGTANIQASGYGYESGTAIATTRTLNVPNFGTETISGTLNYNYAVQNGYLGYLFAGGNVRSYRLDMNSMVDMGQGYIQVNGNMNLSSTGNVSGSLTSFSQGGSKLLMSETITGAFNVSGNVTSSASVTGTMTGWNDQYYDGSYDSFSGSRYIGSTTNITSPMLADPSLWNGDDNFNIELTGNITSSIVINSGSGNDTIAFKGGGSTVSINAGSGNNIISLQNSAALVIASSGNDNITDASRMSTVIFSGKYSDYSLSFNDANNTLTVTDHIAGRDGIDTLNNVGYLRFTDTTQSFADYSNTQSQPPLFSTPTGYIQPNQHYYRLAKLLVRIAKSAPTPDPEHIARLEEAERKLRDKSKGISKKMWARLRILVDEENTNKILMLPHDVMQEIDREKPTITDAWSLQSALIVSLLLVAPMREATLAFLDIEKHFKRESKDRFLLIIPQEETSNGRALEFIIQGTTLKILMLYLKTYRPLLAPKTNTTLLVSRTGRQKLASELSLQIEKFIKKRTGLTINIGLFRHFAAYLHLRHNKDDVETVRRLLSHVYSETTVTLYNLFIKQHAFDTLDQLIRSEKGVKKNA